LIRIALLIEGNQRIESFYMLNLTTWVGLETIPKRRSEFAIKLLEEGSTKIELIICRNKIDKEDSAQIILDYLKSKNLSIPVIVLGTGKTPAGAYTHINNSLDLKNVIKNSAKALNITAQEMAGKIVPDYFPIPIQYFTHLKRSVCDVFAIDFDDDKKYIKRINKLEAYAPEFITNMISEGVDYLYVDKLDRLDFVNNVTNELVVMMEQNELDENEQINAAEKGVELLSNKLKTIGINEETITLAKKNMEIIRGNVKRNPQLAKLIDRLLSNKTGYLFKHTQVLTFVALHIIRNIDWGTAEQEEKIAFICFFHDIALETDQQGMINSNLELKKANFNTKEKTLVEKHAQMAAEMVSKFPHAPMGSDQIIRQHHGQLNGVGFSEHYGANISPLAIVFIIAEEFTRIILKREFGPFDRPEMIAELRQEFTTARFQKTVDLLESITF
jgi:HD-GYP domain-containing protein (c-di-GMP phosphodiesterase class II)